MVNRMVSNLVAERSRLEMSMESHSVSRMASGKGETLETPWKQLNWDWQLLELMGF